MPPYRHTIEKKKNKKKAYAYFCAGLKFWNQWRNALRWISDHDCWATFSRMEKTVNACTHIYISARIAGLRFVSKTYGKSLEVIKVISPQEMTLMTFEFQWRQETRNPLPSHGTKFAPELKSLRLQAPKLQSSCFWRRVQNAMRARSEKAPKISAVLLALPFLGPLNVGLSMVGVLAAMSMAFVSATTPW